MVPLPETDVEEDHGDAGLMISNSGQEYPLQIMFNVQERSVWTVEILGVRVGDLRSSDMRKEARQGSIKANLGQQENSLKIQLFPACASLRWLGSCTSPGLSIEDIRFCLRTLIA